MTELASRTLTRRIAVNRERIERLSASQPTRRSGFTCGAPSMILNDPGRWTVRRGVDIRDELDRSVAQAIACAEWRVRIIEETLRAKGPHGLSDDLL